MYTLTIPEANKEKIGELTLIIEEQTAIFIKNNNSFINKGNKLAGKRARAATQAITKAAKEYRAESLKIMS